MTTHKELKAVGENCIYYSYNSLISQVSSDAPVSCTTCFNWSGAKCQIGVYDSVEKLIEKNN